MRDSLKSVPSLLKIYHDPAQTEEDRPETSRRKMRLSPLQRRRQAVEAAAKRRAEEEAAAAEAAAAKLRRNKPLKRFSTVRSATNVGLVSSHIKSGVEKIRKEAAQENRAIAAFILERQTAAALVLQRNLRGHMIRTGWRPMSEQAKALKHLDTITAEMRASSVDKTNVKDELDRITQELQHVLDLGASEQTATILAARRLVNHLQHIEEERAEALRKAKEDEARREKEAAEARARHNKLIQMRKAAEREAKATNQRIAKATAELLSAVEHSKHTGDAEALRVAIKTANRAGVDADSVAVSRAAALLHTFDEATRKEDAALAIQKVYRGSVGRHNLQTLHRRATQIQSLWRGRMARKLVSQKRQLDEDDVADLFGELGVAFQDKMDKKFQHVEREGDDAAEVQRLLTKNVSFAYIYADEDRLKAATNLAVQLQKNTRRFLLQRHHRNFMETTARRRDARDGNWYTKAEFVKNYGGDKQWKEAMLLQYQHAEEEREAHSAALALAHAEKVAREEAAKLAAIKAAEAKKIEEEKAAKKAAEAEKRRVRHEQIRKDHELIAKQWALRDIQQQAANEEDSRLIHEAENEAENRNDESEPVIDYKLHPEKHPIFVASVAGNAMKVQELLAANAHDTIHAKSPTNSTDAQYSHYYNPLAMALHAAAAEGHAGVVAALIAVGQQPLLESLHPPTAEGITPLHFAVRTRDDGVVKVLLEGKADPHLECSHGATAPEAAIFRGTRGALQLLLEHDAVHINSRRPGDGNTLMMLAAYEGRFDMVRDILAAGGHDPVTVLNDHGHSVQTILSDCHGKELYEVGIADADSLLLAAETNDVEMAKRCIELNTNVDCCNEDGMTPIIIASYFGSVDVLRELVAAKANPNILPASGTPCLIFAVSQNHIDVVKVLTTAYGDELDQTLTANENTTALYLASQENHQECLELLLAHSTAALHQKKDGGVSPLYMAAHEGHEVSVQLLLDAKAVVDDVNGSGVTPLYIAVQRNHDLVCDRLLQAHADPNRRTKNDAAPLALAVFHCNARIVSLLLAAGASIEVRNGKEGNTVVMLAAYSLDVDILCQLLLHGASLNVRSNNGLTVDDILRTAHGISIQQVAFYCLAQHGAENAHAVGGAEVCILFCLEVCRYSLSYCEQRIDFCLFCDPQFDDKQKIQELFDRIDHDGDGHVTKQELTNALSTWGMASKCVTTRVFVHINRQF